MQVFACLLFMELKSRQAWKWLQRACVATSSLFLTADTVWMLTGCSCDAAAAFVTLHPTADMLLCCSAVRCCFQLRVSQNALLYISSSNTEEDDDVRLELQQLLPRSARAVLAHIAAAGPGSPPTLQQQQQQQRVASSRIAAAGRMDAAASAGSSSSKPQSPLAKARSSPLIKSALGSANLFAALQGGSSARSLAAAAAAAAARPGSGGSGSSQAEDASGAAGGSDGSTQQQQRLAALGFGIERFDGDLVKLLRCGGAASSRCCRCS
jgi:hypothetical protein